GGSQYVEEAIWASPSVSRTRIPQAANAAAACTALVVLPLPPLRLTNATRRGVGSMRSTRSSRHCAGVSWYAISSGPFSNVADAAQRRIQRASAACWTRVQHAAYLQRRLTLSAPSSVVDGQPSPSPASCLSRRYPDGSPPT